MEAMVFSTSDVRATGYLREKVNFYLNFTPYAKINAISAAGIGKIGLFIHSCWEYEMVQIL